MASSARLVPLLCAAFALAACGGDDNNTRVGDARTDSASTDAPRTDGPTGDRPAAQCVDTDGDGLEDRYEGTVDLDHDGLGNNADDDSDGDGFSDADEARRGYPGYMANARSPLTCGMAPDDCDGDGQYNFVDFDSDDDGLTDAEERAAHTDPCTDDTDGDGVPDLTERAAMSDPTDPMSRPPTGTLYVTLPYSPPGSTRAHELREFEFQTRIRTADLFFLVDTTGSMQRTIDTLRSTITTRIIPGIAMALPGGDLRYGMGDFRDLPTSGYGANTDWIVRVRQRLDADPMRSLAAVSSMSAALGGDWPEAQVEALYQTLEGTGIAGHEGDLTPSLAMGGSGWAGPMSPDRDCPGTPNAYGWGCFAPGRVPILVLFSDADWHNGLYSSYPYAGVRGLQNYTTLRAAMRRRGAYFVGIDVGSDRDTYTQSEQLARDTDTLDAMGNPIVFNNPGGGPEIADSVVMALSRIVNGTRQDITTRTDGDAMETRLPATRGTQDFLKSVTPLRGTPDAPAGFDHFDTTTFYNVAPTTQVTFRVDFYNDFYPGGATAQLFRATIVVLGRAGTEVDRRPVFIIVPAAAATPG